MRAPLKYLLETHIVGRRCRELTLDSVHMPALRNAPFAWIGYSVIKAPYRIVRLRPAHSHIVAGISGHGRTLIGGKVVEWNPGQVLLAPAGSHHAFEIDGAGPWTIAWLFFDDVAATPVLQMQQAELVEADAGDFVSTLRMLLREASGAAQPTMMEALVAALNTYARRLSGSDVVDLRLWRLWERVESDLSREWTVLELAKLACMSDEHLRRLCHKHYQQSPMEHLTGMRMKRASTLLRSSPTKIEEIASKTGYASVYSFSAAFSRWNGTPPGRFRRG